MQFSLKHDRSNIKRFISKQQVNNADSSIYRYIGTKTAIDLFHLALFKSCRIVTDHCPFCLTESGDKQQVEIKLYVKKKKPFKKKMATTQNDL